MGNQNISCPVCGHLAPLAFFQGEGVPVHQNLVIADRDAARSIARGDLDLRVCEACGFVFNAAFDLSKLSYDQDYDNTQSHSAFFKSYLDDLVHHLVNERDVQNCRIVEVGCGKGLFLRKLVEQNSGNTGYGFDPTYEGPDEELNGRLLFERSFYGPESAHVAADVVVCRHVIEHVPEPVELLRAIRGALEGSPRARIYFETPCVKWILENQVVWDFFYEHCSLFTEYSLSTAFETAGFQVENVKHIFGGQYLWIEAIVARGAQNVSKEAENVPELAVEFARVECQLKIKWTDQVRKLAEQGSVALWGAGAKGVTFANLIDPEQKMIACVVDLNPHKQGRFLAGSGHPIVAPEKLAEYNVTTAILMNPNYREENLKVLNELGLKTTLIEMENPV